LPKILLFAVCCTAQATMLQMPATTAVVVLAIVACHSLMVAAFLSIF